MKKSEIEERTTELVMPIIEEGGFELWDVEYVKEGPDFILRVYADKEGGIGIDDCVAISRKLSDKLDEDDFIKEAYILEVSSPGLTRPLQDIKDYIRYEGEQLDVTMYSGEPKKFTADYEVKEDSIVFTNGVEAELKDIAKAVRHLDF